MESLKSVFKLMCRISILDWYNFHYLLVKWLFYVLRSIIDGSLLPFVHVEDKYNRIIFGRSWVRLVNNNNLKKGRKEKEKNMTQNNIYTQTLA